MSNQQPEVLLGRVGLFQGLSHKELKVIAGAAKEMEFSPGEVVAAEGEEGSRFFVIIEGTASVDVSGKAQPGLGPGDYFGEISLIDGKPRAATVVAQSRLRTLSLVSWNFAPLLEEHPSITHKLLLAMCDRLRAAEHPG